MENKKALVQWGKKKKSILKTPMIEDGPIEVTSQYTDISELIESNDNLEFKKTQFMITAIAVMLQESTVNRVYKIEGPIFKVYDTPVSNERNKTKPFVGAMIVRFHLM